MLNIGKKIRLSRIINQKSGKTIIVPIDHSITMGPITGLENPTKLIKKLITGGVDGILCHAGVLINSFAQVGIGSQIGTILHLSASTILNARTNYKVIINQMETAVSLGVDGVSIQINLADEQEPEMLRDAGEISNQCMHLGMPLLAMVYTKGKDHITSTPELIAHCARLAGEIGCDLVKVSYSGDTQSMKKIVDSALIPVVIAGGSKLDDLATLQLVEGAMQAGCAGLSVGRNIFQREDPSKILKAIKAIVHEGKSANEARKLI